MEPISIFMNNGSESSAGVYFSSQSDGNFQTSVSYNVSVNDQEKGGKTVKISSENSLASVNFAGLKGTIRLFGEATIIFSGTLTEGTNQIGINNIIIGFLSYN